MLFFLPPAAASDNQELFDAAFKKAVLASYKNWSVTQTSDDGEEVKIERLDYSKVGDNRWELISVDGKKPTKKTIKKYLKEKRKEAKTEREKRAKNNQDDALQYLLNRSVVPMVKPGTLKQVQQTETTSVYQFRPQMPGKDEKEMEANLFGEIIVQKSSAQIAQVRLFNKKTFSMQGAKISRFNQTMKFASPEGASRTNPPTFLKSIEMVIQGKAMGIFSMDQSQKITFTDYSKTVE